MDIIEKIRNKEIKGYLTTKKRIIFEGAIYHVTQRAPGRELVFVGEGDYLKFLSILKKCVKNFNLNLFCFTLMPNHLHLMLKIKKKNLSEAMMYLFQNYAIYYNRKYKRKGHVFCGRYRASLCNDEIYLLAASIYIHLNPYKAGLTEHFDDYRWGSLSLYTRRTKNTFVNFKSVLSILDIDIKKARQKYRRMLENSMKVAGGNLSAPKSVNKFIERTKIIVGRLLKRQSDLDGLIEKFRDKEKVVDPEEKKARKYLFQQLKANGYSVKEIFELFGISRKTYYNIINKEE